MASKSLILEVCVDSVQSAVRLVPLLAYQWGFETLNATLCALIVPHTEGQTGSRCVEISVLEGGQRHPLASSVRFRKLSHTSKSWLAPFHNITDELRDLNAPTCSLIQRL